MAPEQIARRSVGELYGSEDLATEMLMAYKQNRVPRELPPQVARAATKASGRLKVRLNWLTFELHRFADKMRTGDPPAG